MKIIIALFIFISYSNIIEASQHDDVRCKCVCPDPNVLLEELANTSTKQAARKLYIDNVPPGHCNCDWMVLPKLDQDLYKNKSKELCPRCECKYESRNLGMIKWAVSAVVCVILFLTGYMAFLMGYEYLYGTGQRISYQEQINEEVSMDDQSSDAQRNSVSSLDDIAIIPSKNVINRVNQQQSKWKKQIEEQRKNIYDRHSMLN